MDIAIQDGLAEARAMARRNWQPLLVYVGLGVLLPFLLLSSEPIFDLRTPVAIAADPWTYRVSGSITGPLYLLGIVSLIVSGALLAAWNALLADIREGYISEIMYGLVAGAAYLTANMILYFGVGIILSLPILLIAGFQKIQSYGIAFAIVRYIVTAMLGSWIYARFCLVGPVMAAGGRLEPVSAFAESWRRTRTAWPRLFGLYLAIYVLSGLLTLALLAPHLFILFNSAPGSFAETAMSVGWLLFWIAYFLMLVLVPAGLYRASDDRTAVAVFA